MLTCVLYALSACAARQAAWVPIEPRELPDGGGAFVLAQGAALQLADVEYADGYLRGTVVHAWALPSVGVAAIAGDTRTMSPEDIARRASWPELALAHQRVEVPVETIRSARAAVEPEPDPTENELAGQVLGTVAIALSTVLLEPRCCRISGCCQASRWQCQH